MNWRLPSILSVVFATAALFPYASPVRDAATSQLTGGFHWHFSLTYLLLTPPCSFADFLTALGLHEQLAFLLMLSLLLIASPLRWKTKGLSALGFVGFVFWTALAPRPMARLQADDPDILLIDFHSHTAYSHDGRRGFSPEANARWHERQGFGAAFITDHNVVVGARQGMASSQAAWPHPRYSVLPGEEVSLYNTHIGVLGNTPVFDHSHYDSSYSMIPMFIRDMHKQGYLVVAHLPEYWREHWKEKNLDFLHWNVDGFEIVNSVPYCLDFPKVLRRQIVAHCRDRNLFMTGVSDNHGWGSATAAWSAMRIPDWRNMNPDQLQAAVLKTLRTKKFVAVQVLERLAFYPETTLGLLISPVVNSWIYLRSLGRERALAWVAWIWLLAVIRNLNSERRSAK